MSAPRNPDGSAVTHTADAWAAADPAAARGPDAPGAFDVDEAHRYRDPMPIGVGAMGRVEAVFDQRLGRLVAMKTIKAELGRGVSTARFVREATLTAGLAHPAIVSVHDAGRRADGRLFYTMHLVDGRPLSAVIAEAADDSARERLLRPFHQACEAVAFAHAHGIIHRDLKPSNIMLSDFGQVQVVDWGLARRVSDPGDDAGSPASPSPSPSPEAGDLTAFGAVLGTPAYMSPEQARGDAADPRTDVWALGAVLFELLTGRRWSDTPGRLDALDAELAAIVTKALSDDTASRYVDAGALAEDLGSYLEGERVRAHQYSTWALLRRLYRAWRAPILVAAAAVAVLVVGGVLSYRATIAERDRALAAEGQANRSSDAARAASARADAQLASTLGQEASRRLTRGDVAATTIFAGESLLLEPASPAVRGVWASVPERPLARMTARLQLPPDCRPTLSRAEPLVACVVPTGIELWDVARGELRWSAELGVATDVAFADALGVVFATRAVRTSSSALNNRYSVAFDVVTGDPHPLLEYPSSTASSLRWEGLWGYSGSSERLGWRHVAADGRMARPFRVSCPTHPGLLTHAVDPVDGRAALLCETETLFVDLATSAVQRSLPPPPTLTPTAAAFAGDRLLVGDVEGHAVPLDLATGAGEVHRLLGEGMVHGFDVTDDGARALVRFDRSAAVLLDVASGEGELRVPELLGDVATLSRDGRWLTTVDGDRVARRFAVDRDDPSRHTIPVGATGVAFAPDGALAVTSKAVVHLFAPDGAARDLPGVELFKGGTFSADGRRFYAATLLSGIARWRVDGWEPLVALTPPDGGYRWIHALADGWLLAGGFHNGITLIRDTPDASPERAELLPQDVIIDADVRADGRAAVALSRSGDLYAITLAAGDPPLVALLGAVPDASEVAMLPSGDLATTDGTALRLLDAQTLREVWSAPLGDRRVLDVAASGDGRWLATGERQGTARVWSVVDGAVVADLRGHVERVVTVGFDPTSRWLVTGSWDRSVRRWDLRRLEDGPEAIRRRLAAAEAAWDIDLDRLLAR